MASKYRKKFSLPEGFYPILEAYSREVLRDQPQDIIEFSYLYFKALEEVSRPLRSNCSFRAQLRSSTTRGRARTSPRQNTCGPSPSRTSSATTPRCRPRTTTTTRRTWQRTTAPKNSTSRCLTRTRSSTPTTMTRTPARMKTPTARKSSTDPIPTY